MDVNLQTTISEKFRNTELGFLRIRKNLQISNYSDAETERYLREVILSTDIDRIEKRGKNYYFECVKYNAILTINSHSLTVITAKKYS